MRCRMVSLMRGPPVVVEEAHGFPVTAVEREGDPHSLETQSPLVLRWLRDGGDNGGTPPKTASKARLDLNQDRHLAR
jgi:hypothetical protein